MKKDQTMVSLWVTTGTAALVVLMFLIAGNLLVIGTRLGAVHPWLEVAFYAAAIFLIYWVVCRPILAVVRSPVVSLEKIVAEKADVPYGVYRQVGRQLIDRGNLSNEEVVSLRGALESKRTLREPIRAILESRKISCLELVRQKAVLAFLATGISQSGRLDAFVLLAINVRMVRALVEHFGYRPPLPRLLKIYSQVLLAALVLDGVEDLDMETLASSLGATTLAHLPGFKLIAGSLMQGSASALFTLKVGILTRNALLNAGEPLDRTEMRQTAIKQAAQQLPAVLLEGIKSLPGKLGKLAAPILE